MSTDTTFGAWVRRLRRSHDLTQEALSEQVNCALATLRAIETGRRRPSYELATLLAERLAVPDAERELFLALARSKDAVAVPLPTSALPPAPEQPPAEPPHLIGRSAELAALRARLNNPACRLLTIIGPGGIGKSALAAALLTDLAATRPDGVVSVTLAGAADPAAALTAIARALGASLDDEGLSAGIAAALERRKMILFLDNLEHLLGDERLIDLIGRVLAGAPDVQILAASRQQLNLRAEQTYTLGGLATPTEPLRPDDAPPAAMQLFLERARRLRHDFALTPANSSAVAAICRLVGGMPLAIELAAAWTPIITPADIAAEIRRSIDLLASSEHDAAQAHRSIRAVLDRSWATLNREEQAALARLALFHGSFSREAAEYVAGARLPVLAALIRKSFVQRRGERYALHELTRQYAAEQLAALPGAPALNHRYIDYYLALCATADEAHEISGDNAPLELLDQERDNLRAALDATQQTGRNAAGARLCTMLRNYWLIRGYIREGMRRAEQIALHGGLSGADRGHALNAFLHMARLAGEGARVDPLLDEAVALHRQAGDILGLAVALQNLGEGLMEQHAFARAFAAYEESQALHERLGHHHRVAITYGLMANVAIVQGDYARAIQLADTSAAIAVRTNNTYVITGARWLIGLVQTLQADPVGVELLRPGLQTFAAYRYVAGVAFSLEALAAQAALHGDPQLGGRLFGAAAAIRARTQVPITLPFQRDVDRLAALAQAGLTPEAWQAAVAAGRMLSSDEAITLALTVGRTGRSGATARPAPPAQDLSATRGSATD